MKVPSSKHASLLTIGQGCVYGCSFLRNIILARTLTKADFGLAAVFAMTITLLELGNKMSFGVQIIQTQNTSKSDLQANLHSAMVLSGLLSGLLILWLSKPFSILFNAQHASIGFALLALVPLLRSFEHLDHFRFRRDYNYKPGILVELFPQLLVTIIAWPLARHLNDYRAVVYLVLARSATSLVMTHLVAKTPYDLNFKGRHFRSIFRFSWPLLLNGFVLFGAQQADQLLIGSFLTLEDLALYYSAFALAIVPYYIIGPVQNSLLLPVLSKIQNKTSEFNHIYCKFLGSTVFISTLVLVPLAAIGEEFLVFFYGSKYSGSGLIIPLLCAATALLIFRSVSATAALAHADSKSQLFTHLFRSMSIPIAAITLLVSKNIQLVALSAVVAEIAANAYSIYRLKSQHKIPISHSTRPLLFIICSTSSPILSNLYGSNHNITWSIIIMSTHLAAIAIFAAIILPEGFSYIYKQAFKHKSAAID